MRIFTFFLLLVLNITAYAGNSITININTSQDNKEISSYIYGINDYGTSSSIDDNWGAFRWGGNRTTAYNWTNNASNAGDDWFHSSDNHLVSGFPHDERDIPAIVITKYHDKVIEHNAYSLVTLQMAGYVARDMDGTVGEDEIAPSSRWTETEFKKDTEFTLEPDPEDDVVYIDELVNYLVTEYGNATSEEGINAYGLDNEPALWSSTHERMHPEQATCTEIVSKGIELASAVKDIDPNCEIYGPVLYGFGAYTNFQNAPDWNDVSSGEDYDWFIDYYLDEMKKESEEQDRRLLDVLSLNWYPEARGDNRIVFDPEQTINDHLARVQAPRTLWDPDYAEDSWIGEWGQEHLPLIPKIKESINEYNPGTNLAFSEFSYGGSNHISGGIAIADVLGIFGKYGVYMSTHWGEVEDYTASGYKIYRNYDGNQSAYADINVFSETSDIENSSVYASVCEENNDNLHVIVINKDFENSMSGDINIDSDGDYIFGEVWAFSNNNMEITKKGQIENIESNSFSYNFPAASVSHLIISKNRVTLTVNSGSGSGDYPEGAKATIIADVSPEGQQFAEWTGDIEHADDANSALTTLTIPESDVSITATYEDIPETTFALTVTGGDGSGDYGEGAEATIVADTAPEGEQFAGWTGNIGYLADASSALTVVTMPADNVSVEATYELITYNLTVTNGSGSGNYAPGESFNITADKAPEGKQFAEWTGDIEFLDDVNDAETSFTMPDHNVTIEATYEIATKGNTDDIYHKKYGINLYPNPAKKYVKVTGQELGENVVIQIINLNGTVIFKENMGIRDKLIIDTSSLPKGVYIVNVNSSIVSLNKKLIIE